MGFNLDSIIRRFGVNRTHGPKQVNEGFLLSRIEIYSNEWGRFSRSRASRIRHAVPGMFSAYTPIAPDFGDTHNLISKKMRFTDLALGYHARTQYPANPLLQHIAL